MITPVLITSLLLISSSFSSDCIFSYCKGSRVSIPRPLLDLRGGIEKGVYSVKINHENSGSFEPIADFVVDNHITASLPSPSIRIECHDTLLAYSSLPLLDLCLGITKMNTELVTTVTKSKQSQIQSSLQPPLYLPTSRTTSVIFDNTMDVQWIDLAEKPSEIIDWVTEDGEFLASFPR
jgi:hypothetical protein